ncbi:MAG: hypothetical protein ACRD28_07490 [Acidobacteriaceae bacterium]
MTKQRTICVYCGSSIGAREDYRASAAELGTAMAKEGIRLVYGGAHIGLMGVMG